MQVFEHIEKIINNNPLEKQDMYVPGNSELISEEIVLHVNKKKLILENLHFVYDVKFNIISDSSISIKNCTFDKSVIFKPNLEIDSEPTLDIRIFKTIASTYINFNRCAKYGTIELDCCVTHSANFADDSIEHISIYRSEIDNLYLESNIINTLSITDSYICKITNYAKDIKTVEIDADSIRGYYSKFKNIKLNNFIDYAYIKKCRSEIIKNKNLLIMRLMHGAADGYKISNDDLKNNISVSKEAIKETKQLSRKNYLRYIQLLKKSTDESIDDHVISELNYLYLKNKKYSWYIFILLSSIGFFYKPSRVILLSVTTILFFGLMLFALDHLTCSTANLSNLFTTDYPSQTGEKLLNAMYSSGLTFFTLGYSLPTTKAVASIQHIKQFFTLMEAGIGIILTSTILISFMNKYLFSYRNN